MPLWLSLVPPFIIDHLYSKGLLEWQPLSLIRCDGMVKCITDTAHLSQTMSILCVAIQINLFVELWDICGYSQPSLIQLTKEAIDC